LHSELLEICIDFRYELVSIIFSADDLAEAVVVLLSREAVVEGLRDIVAVFLDAGFYIECADSYINDNGWR